MKVFVDGAEISLNDGAILKDALDVGGVAPPPEGAIIGIVKGREEEAKETNSYWLNTTKGKLRIELLDTGIQEAWHKAVDQISGLKVRWSDGAAVAFGPLSTRIAPTRREHEYDRWEVVFGASGFEADKAQIVFARKRHSAAYGAPAENRGVFASVVGGKTSSIVLIWAMRSWMLSRSWSGLPSQTRWRPRTSPFLSPTGWRSTPE